MLAALLSIALQAAPARPPVEQPVTLTTATGPLHGTLMLPARDGKMPVALIIAGSGPVNRDGNAASMLNSDTYKLLATALAEHGIASLRYDKRGIGESRPAGGREDDLRFETGVDDAAAWIEQLHADPRFSRVVVIGHSEGSLVGILAARHAHADALVSIAGVARRASDILRDQLRPQIGAMPELWTANETVLTSLEAGKTIDPLPGPMASMPAFQPLYRPSVQPYLISWFKYVPTTEIKTLTVPVLIVQGTTDMQVPVDEAKALKTAKPDAELAIVDGMNHIMKTAPADRTANLATYSNPDLPLASDAVKSIVAFIARER